MADMNKGKSPFYPGHPVPTELFVGRARQIERIMARGAGQVAAGKPIAMYVEGEYGIGKSSIAGYVQSLAERQYGLHGIYATLGGAKDLADVAAAVLGATVRSGAFDAQRGEKIRNWLSKYVGKQGLFGFELNLEGLKQDAPRVSTHFDMLTFLTEVRDRLGDEIKGIFLILDEINGITQDPQFSHFIKGLVDTNAMSPRPLPLLLMLCGVEERRHEMIQKYQPIDRIFDIVEIKLMSSEEMRECFTRAFGSAQMTVTPDAMAQLVRYSAGFPKIMHLIGDAAYWLDRDGIVDINDANQAIAQAAEDFGKKFVDQQVYKALRWSRDYHSILSKIAQLGPDVMTFTKAQVVASLTENEKKNFGNFIRKMKQLNVIRDGDKGGEYIFIVAMVRYYIWLQSLPEEQANEEPKT